MTPRSWVRFISLSVLLLLTTGCFSYRSASIPSPTTFDRVRVTPRDDERIEVLHVRTDSLGIEGFTWDGSEVRFLFQEMELLETRQFDGLRTVGCLSLVAIGVSAAWMLIYLARLSGAVG